MIMYCSCGKEIFDKKLLEYELIQKNRRGQIVFAKCFHGTVVLDNREEKK